MSYSQVPTEDTSPAKEFRESPQSRDTVLLWSSTCDSHTVPKENRSRTFWTLFVTFVAILITFLNLSLLSIDIFHSHGSESITLRRPSTYIGLDQLKRNASSPGWPRTRYDFPDSFRVVNPRMPNELQLDAKQVNLDSTHTVIIHFTVRDFGLENCAVSSFFPKQDQYPAKQFIRGNFTNGLQVWLLEDTEGSPVGTFQPSTKPQRNRLLGTLDASITHDSTPFFHCPSRSTLTVEISCPDAECTLEFLQERPGRKLGFWLLQSEGLPS